MNVCGPQLTIPARPARGVCRRAHRGPRPTAGGGKRAGQRFSGRRRGPGCSGRRGLERGAGDARKLQDAPTPGGSPTRRRSPRRAGCHPPRPNRRCHRARRAAVCGAPGSHRRPLSARVRPVAAVPARACHQPGSRGQYGPESYQQGSLTTSHISRINVNRRSPRPERSISRVLIPRDRRTLRPPAVPDVCSTSNKPIPIFDPRGVDRPASSAGERGSAKAPPPTSLPRVAATSRPTASYLALRRPAHTRSGGPCTQWSRRSLRVVPPPDLRVVAPAEGGDQL